MPRFLWHFDADGWPLERIDTRTGEHVSVFIGRPKESLLFDVKSLARFHRVGHRITGDRQQGRSYGVRYDKVQVAVDDAIQLAYVEVPPDEQKPTVIGILNRAVAWFNGQGIECRRVMSDNCPAYVSRAFARAYRILGLRHIRTKPYTPRTNGKAERFIQTLCRDLAYAMSFQNSEERSRWLPRYLGIYNRLRKHSALGCAHLSSGSTRW